MGVFGSPPCTGGLHARDRAFRHPRRAAGSRTERAARVSRPVCRLAGVVCAAVLLASCARPGYWIRKGRSRSAQLLLLINATEIMLVVVVPVILATLGFAWWYRSSNPAPVGARNWPMKGASILSSGRSRRWSSFCWAGSAGSARISWIRGRRSRRIASRSRSTSSRSIGNGCSSIPIRVLPPSISWSSRREHRSAFV